MTTSAPKAVKLIPKACSAGDEHQSRSGDEGQATGDVFLVLIPPVTGGGERAPGGAVVGFEVLIGEGS
jgi:hypothetical protein